MLSAFLVLRDAVQHTAAASAAQLCRAVEEAGADMMRQLSAPYDWYVGNLVSRVQRTIRSEVHAAAGAGEVERADERAEMLNVWQRLPLEAGTAPDAHSQGAHRTGGGVAQLADAHRQAEHRIRARRRGGAGAWSLADRAAFSVASRQNASISGNRGGGGAELLRPRHGAGIGAREYGRYADSGCVRVCHHVARAQGRPGGRCDPGGWFRGGPHRRAVDGTGRPAPYRPGAAPDAVVPAVGGVPAGFSGVTQLAFTGHCSRLCRHERLSGTRGRNRSAVRPLAGRSGDVVCARPRQLPGQFSLSPAAGFVWRRPRGTGLKAGRPDARDMHASPPQP
eukprot:ctg_2416.g576